MDNGWDWLPYFWFFALHDSPHRLLDHIAHHEHLLFSEKWTEDLQSDRKIDASIISRRSIPDWDRESWDTCEWSRDREYILEIECERISSLCSDSPCNSWCCRSHDDIYQRKCVRKVLTNQFSYCSRFQEIGIIESRRKHIRSDERSTLDLISECLGPIGNDISSGSSDLTISDPIISGKIGCYLCWTDCIVCRYPMFCVWEWYIDDLSTEFAYFCNSGIDSSPDTWIDTIHAIFSGYPDSDSLEIWSLPYRRIESRISCEWCQVTRIMSSSRLIEESCIADCPSEVSWSVERWCHRHHSIARVATISRLESDNPTHTRGLSNRSTRICPESGWYESSCYCYSRSWWWSSRNTGRVPWIVSRAECTILTTSSHCELIHIGFTKWEISASLQAFCHSRLIRWDEVLEHPRARCCADSLFAEYILDSHRQSWSLVCWLCCESDTIDLLLCSLDRVKWQCIESIQFVVVLFCSLEEVVIYFFAGGFITFYKFWEFDEGEIFVVHFCVWVSIARV